LRAQKLEARQPRMKTAFLLLACIFISSLSTLAQSPGEQIPLDSDFKISLPKHPGRLEWKADGFRITEVSAKSKGQEIGLRGSDGQGQITFLGFLFLVLEQAPLTSAKCDGALEEERNNPSLKSFPIPQSKNLKDVPVAMASYSARGDDGATTYVVRGFVARGDICGDLEIYSKSAIGAEDAGVKRIFDSFRLDPRCEPQFKDMLLFAQILHKHQEYGAAAPFFELALSKLSSDKSEQTMRRVITDQAGMSYGISGDIAKARVLFEEAIARTLITPCITTILRAQTLKRRSWPTRRYIFRRHLRAKRTRFLERNCLIQQRMIRSRRIGAIAISGRSYKGSIDLTSDRETTCPESATGRGTTCWQSAGKRLVGISRYPPRFLSSTTRKKSESSS